MVKPVVVVLLLCAASIAQQNKSLQQVPAARQASEQKATVLKESPKAAAPQLSPVYDVILSPNPDVSTTSGSGYYRAEGCDGSGNPYFSISRNYETQVYGLTPKGVVSFDARKISDVPSLTFLEPYVAPSGLYVLAAAIDAAKLAEAEREEKNDPIWRPVRDPIRRLFLQGEARFYIVRFDLDGSYKQSVKLKFDLYPQHFGAFDSGNLVLVALDKNNAAHLAMLDSSGQLLNYLPLQKNVAESPKAASGTDNGMWNEVIDAALASVSSHKESVLVTMRDSRTGGLAAIYEVRGSGEVRMVKSKVSFAHLLQSDRNWFAFGLDTFDEINPETGELLGHYRPNQIEEADRFACLYEHKFIGLRNTDGKLMLLNGVIERAAKGSEAVVQQQ